MKIFMFIFMLFSSITLYGFAFIGSFSEGIKEWVPYVITGMVLVNIVTSSYCVSYGVFKEREK